MIIRPVKVELFHPDEHIDEQRDGRLERQI